MEKQCKHKVTRYLDCAECEAKGEICPIIICVECGETVDDRKSK